MTVSEFLLLYPLRATKLMWFLGAGASASSGVATAGDMIWDFKRRLYCAQQKVPLRACDDIGDPVLQQKLQRYFDNAKTFPPVGSVDEYAHYFSTVFPTEVDRRSYIQQMVSSAIPSFGYLALAVLMKNGLARIIWTTNFDRNVEDSAAKVFKSTKNLVVAALDSPQLLGEAIQEERWPILGKLHGDFQSRRLKNVSDELRSQDEQMRRALIAACQRYGLIVAGYSGRDDSIMDALEDAIDGGKGYPSGIFWFTRDANPADRVRNFIAKARDAQVEAHLVEVQTFDEVLADTISQVAELPAEDTEMLSESAQRCTAAPLRADKGGWPVVRLNAVELMTYPATCRVLECEIGGVSEVRKAVESSGAKIVATRKKAGVLFFGADEEAQKAFGSFKIRRFDIFTIETRRLWYDSAEQGLLYDALICALAREYGFLVDYRGGHPLVFVNPADSQRQSYAPLRKCCNQITGVVPKTESMWSEGVVLRLAFRLNRLWLVIEPTIWIEKALPESADVMRDFQRERQATRYNRIWNSLIQAWAETLTQGLDSKVLKAFGVDGNGVDATFEVGKTSAFSRRLYRK